MTTQTTIFTITVLVFLCYMPDGTLINVNSDDECNTARVKMIYGETK